MRHRAALAGVAVLALLVLVAVFAERLGGADPYATDLANARSGPAAGPLLGTDPIGRDQWSVHYNVSADGKLFAGDGGDPGQVAFAKDGQWINLFRPGKGTSHCHAKHPSAREILTIPARRPIKPVYIRKLVRYIESHGANQ